MRVQGYHGTTLDRAREILRTGFQVSDKPWEWLGRGIYFWQDAPYRARQWGEDWSRKWRREGDVVVVAAEIELGSCLDLLDTFWWPTIGMAVNLLEANLKRNYRNKPDGRHELDCAFFNLLVELLAERGMKIQTIRAAVAEGDPLFPGSPIHTRSHVELVVKDPTLISAVRIIPMEGELLDVERGLEER